MPGRKTRFGLASAVVAMLGAPLLGPAPAGSPRAYAGGLPVPAAVGAPLAALPRPVAVTPAGSVCPNPPEPAEPAGEIPWPQQRYAPERINPLTAGAGVTVAVIDSGVDARHPQLRNRVVRGTDLLNRGGDGRLDCVGHGTAVASIIAGTPIDGVRFRGLAPQATILPLRVSEQQIIEGRESGRTVSAAEFAAAIRWAVDREADVLNLSVVLYEDDPAVRDAVSYALDRDVVVVAAAGNLHEHGDPRPYPAGYDGVLGVGAVGPDGTRAAFSQLGSYVDVVAPGADVLAAAPGAGHRKQNGTSYAVPFAAGTAALVRGYRPDLSAAEVIARIIATADPAPGGVGSDAYGSGIVNPYRAVTETRAAGPPQPTASLASVRSDPAAVELRDRRTQARDHSVRLAAVGGVVAGTLLLLAVVVPNGARRRWRPAGGEIR